MKVLIIFKQIILIIVLNLNINLGYMLELPLKRSGDIFSVAKKVLNLAHSRKFTHRNYDHFPLSVKNSGT